MFLSHVKIPLVTAVLAIAVMAGCSDNSFQGKAAKSSTGSGPASGINGLPGNLPSNLPPGCRNVPTEVPRDTVTTLRCTDTANVNTIPKPLNPPLVAVVGSCPPGKESIGEITFFRYSSQPIYHVNLGPRDNFPNRGFIYVTVLGSPEILGPDETPLSTGTYKVTYDELIRELGISQTIQGSKVVCN
jgi:hypothetical protein